MDTHPSLPVALTIAGSDSGAGAGVQADLLTFAAHSVFGTTVFSCLTAQNPSEVTAVEALPASFIEAQIKAIIGWFHVGAVKTGMLYDTPQIVAVADTLKAYPCIPLIVDPVMVATSGAMLLKPDAVATLRERLIPLATIITPNLDEAAVLLDGKAVTASNMEAAAKELAKCYNVPVLLKGGHLNTNELTDIFSDTAGNTRLFTHPRIKAVNTHGSGCTLSASIAANVARGIPLINAVEASLDYLSKTLRYPLHLNGEAFISHLERTP